MTKEELKQRYSMKEIVEQYGFRPNRAGFIRCPFHTGDRDASLKIYERISTASGAGRMETSSTLYRGWMVSASVKRS